MGLKDRLWIAQTAGGLPVHLLSRMANRHGLIAGATGTGKTVTLQVLAEAFSDAGVPVFLTDIKGDLSGLAAQGEANRSMEERVERLQLDGFSSRAYPVRFWDVYGEAGHPVRSTVSDMGPLLLARLLGLNETQSDVLHVVFRIADDQGLLLLDFKDLMAMVRHVGEQAKAYAEQYGRVSAQSIGAIVRRLVALEHQGAQSFFGEPALDLSDWIQSSQDGRGDIHILHSVRLFQAPLLYSTFLLWLLSELFEVLPEIGDSDKPQMVLFFDEAHVLFEDAPKALLQKMEQVVRLIRSKGVGIYFITQHPADLPADVLGQLGNRIQHALRAYTPAEQRKVAAAVQAFRPNPELNLESAISQLATGEALISCLDIEGRPEVVQRAWILPPHSKVGPIDESERRRFIASSTLGVKYDQAVDRESAYELLQAKASKTSEQRTTQDKPKRSTRQSPWQKAANSAMTVIGRELGRAIIRGLLGSLRKTK